MNRLARTIPKVDTPEVGASSDAGDVTENGDRDGGPWLAPWHLAAVLTAEPHSTHICGTYTTSHK
ncbi:hypothetical protein P280DRAFT_159323 [Massarina eburnea CBS 473.64]|uniref:Uncharacterized protein n=1 Tax=Massarina eburnea CBS 473.64 TaxID=1395130 RepID=A0A6A6RNK6_9PLEO|nr:hypothetical protein P280DRAFT_159323 [Massarina eburnea CBS 473.64]